MSNDVEDYDKYTMMIIGDSYTTEENIQINFKSKTGNGCHFGLFWLKNSEF